MRPGYSSTASYRPDGLSVADETHTHFPQGAIHHVEGGRARLL